MSILAQLSQAAVNEGDMRLLVWSNSVLYYHAMLNALFQRSNIYIWRVNKQTLWLDSHYQSHMEVLKQLMLQFIKQTWVLSVMKHAAL